MLVCDRCQSMLKVERLTVTVNGSESIARTTHVDLCTTCKTLLETTIQKLVEPLPQPVARVHRIEGQDED